MKIVILIYCYHSSIAGGTEIATHRIATELAIRNHEVVVINLSKMNHLPYDNNRQKGLYHLINIESKFLSPLVSPYCLFRSLLELSKFDPDLIHIQSIGLGHIPAMLKAIRKTPFVSCGQGLDVYIDYPFKKVVLFSSLRYSHTIVALTNEMKKRFNEMTDTRIVIVPNGVDIDKFVSDKRSFSRGIIGLALDLPLMLFVGRLAREKGIYEAIDAFERTNETIGNLQLYIIGDGPEKKGVIKRIEKSKFWNSIRLVGKVDHEEISDYFSAADILIVPSHYEGLSLVVLEGFASGLPIVCSATGGLQDIVIEGENGFLANVGAIQEYSDAAIKILTDKQLQQRIRQNNIEKSTTYTWNNTVDSYEALYSQVLSERSNTKLR